MPKSKCMKNNHSEVQDSDSKQIQSSKILLHINLPVRPDLKCLSAKSLQKCQVVQKNSAEANSPVSIAASSKV